MRQVPPAADFATFVAFWQWLPEDDDLESDLKGLMWASCCEYAVLRLDDGRLALVSGGRTRILLHVQAGVVILPIDGVLHRVNELIIHVHPVATGPSDSDFRMLEQLGQTSSVLIELNAGRTVFGRKPAVED